MRKTTTLLAVAVFATITGGAFAAQAQQGHNSRVESYCAQHRNDRDCVAHRRGDHSTVGRIMRKTGNAIVGGVRVVGSAIGSGACDVRYKSYDRRTNTYRGNDGRRHRC